MISDINAGVRAVPVAASLNGIDHFSFDLTNDDGEWKGHRVNPVERGLSPSEQSAEGELNSKVLRAPAHGGVQVLGELSLSLSSIGWFDDYLVRINVVETIVLNNNLTQIHDDRIHSLTCRRKIQLDSKQDGLQ